MSTQELRGEFTQYQRAAMKFRLESADVPYALLGLVGEVGELYGALAKALRDGTDVSPEYIQKELGDILWFIAAIADDAQLDLQDVAVANLEKLLSRAQRGVIQGSGDDR